MQKADLRTSVLRAMIGTGLNNQPKPTFGLQLPKTNPKIKHDGRSIEDFLYAFAIHYGILVKDAQLAGRTPPNREVCLKLFCERYYKEGNLTQHTFATVSKILNCKGAKTQLRPGQWVPASLYVFDAWFDLIIGREYRSQFALDIPESFIKQVDEYSTAAALLTT